MRVSQSRVNRSPRLLVAALLVVLAACAARQAGSPIRPGFNLYSPQQDVEIGKQAAEQIRPQVEEVNDRELANYVNGLGQKLAAQPEAGNYPYSFTLINDPSINAFALPGGPTYLHTGLFTAASTEGELVGVMAHEIAHVALRHGTSQASKANLLQIPALIAGTAMGQSAAAQASQVGLMFGLNAVLLRYSRDAETESDALGARMMAQAGYNPIDMANFFEKLEAEGGSRAPQFLSSHPNPGNRRNAIQAEIQTMPQRSYSAGTGQFERMKAKVGQLPPPRRQAR